MLLKISQQRLRKGKDPNKKYVVVSDTAECYDEVRQMVLDEIYPPINKEAISEVFERAKEKAKETLVKEDQLSKSRVVKQSIKKKIVPKKKVTKNVTSKN
jgi:hypothetical protein